MLRVSCRAPSGDAGRVLGSPRNGRRSEAKTTERIERPCARPTLFAFAPACGHALECSDRTNAIWPDRRRSNARPRRRRRPAVPRCMKHAPPPAPLGSPTPAARLPRSGRPCEKRGYALCMPNRVSAERLGLAARFSVDLTTFTQISTNEPAVQSRGQPKHAPERNST